MKCYFFQRYHKAIFRKTYEQVTLEDPHDDYITRRIRSAVLEWSCRSSDSICSHEASAKFRLWMAKNARYLSSEFYYLKTAFQI